eukprot:Opistho-1_new@6482
MDGQADAHAADALRRRRTITRSTAPLSVLVANAVQRAYGDLERTSLLLPQMRNTERKVALLDYLRRTRQRFLRLYVVLKWLSTADVVAECFDIMGFLDEQTKTFVETADSLYFLREKLANARAPPYAVTTAVDVLATSRYNRLPTAIEDIAPAAAVSDTERDAALVRLNDVISVLLATSLLPAGMDAPVVGKGLVRLRMQGEYEATLTVLSDPVATAQPPAPTPSPWRMVSLSILVDGGGKGDDGRTLVGQGQLDFLRGHTQQRMVAVPAGDAIAEMHAALHSFCLSLRLSLLAAHANSLLSSLWAELVKMDYVTGSHLVLYYWGSQSSTSQGRTQKAAAPVAGSQGDATAAAAPSKHSVRIGIERVAGDLQLAVRLTPTPRDPATGEPLSIALRAEAGGAAVEALLMRVIHAQTHDRLARLRDSLVAGGFGSGDVRLSQGTASDRLDGAASAAHVSVRIHDASWLSVSTDIRSGRLVLSVTEGSAVRDAAGRRVDTAVLQAVAEAEERVNRERDDLDAAHRRIADVVRLVRRRMLVRQCEGAAALVGLEAPRHAGDRLLFRIPRHPRHVMCVDMTAADPLRAFSIAEGAGDGETQPLRISPDEQSPQKRRRLEGGADDKDASQHSVVSLLSSALSAAEWRVPLLILQRELREPTGVNGAWVEEEPRPRAPPRAPPSRDRRRPAL